MIKQTKFLIPIILLIISVSIILPVSGAAHDGKSLEELITHFEQRIPALMDSYNIPGVAIALVED